MRKYQRAFKRNIQKEQNRQLLHLQAKLPMDELLAGIRTDIEAFGAQVGLQIIQGVMEEEIARKPPIGANRTAYRHGRKAGYVIFSGRKVPVEHPRLRSKN